MATMKFPAKGEEKDQLLGKMKSFQEKDVNWREGRTSSLVYYAGEDLEKMLTEAYSMYFYTNGLSPLAFPSLKKFESEVIAMTGDLLNGDQDVVGNMTTGGTESIIMAVKAARDKNRAEKPEIKEPEMVIPNTAHPAFEKAAQYLDVKPVRVAVNDEYFVNVEDMKNAITKNTILMVGSAPAFPHGTVDPIPELAKVAMDHGILFHVDSCLGGFLLPFFRKLGHEFPDFDFSVPGVTSISADIHKYGFGPRGTSTIMYKNSDIRKYMYFSYPNWPGGLYGSPTMTGSRSGAAIATAWATMNYLGEEGYLRLAEIISRTTKKLIDGINAIPELQIMGKPHMSVFAFTADGLDIYSVGEEMGKLGWNIDRLQLPPALHIMVTPAHEKVTEKFLSDLENAVATVKESGGEAEGMAAIYGAMDALPDRSMVNEFIVDFIDSLTALD